MGIDAMGCFYTKEELTQEKLAEYEKQFRARNYEGWEKKTAIFLKSNGRRVIVDFDLLRYWGPGYERGPFETIISVLGWLRRRDDFVEEVFYWGDCNCEGQSNQFDEAMEKVFLEHFFKYGHPYRGQ